MKTAKEWFARLGNRGEYAALPSITLEEIQAIQDDAVSAHQQALKEAKVALEWCSQVRITGNYNVVDKALKAIKSLNL